MTIKKDIIIDLLAPSFAPGHKFYERVKWSLQKISDITFLYSYFVGMFYALRFALSHFIHR